MIIPVRLGESSYDIEISRGAIDLAAEKIVKKDRKILVVTDSGVPKEYSEAIKGVARKAKVVTFPMGEENKSLATYAKICEELLEFNLQRGDAIVSVGGGVCSDIAGFIAATYMRGVDFYTVPTTTLAATDASVGGKNGIDFCGKKNILGAFLQPKGVIIDTDAFKTLDKRQYASGLAEIIKMAATSDAELFRIFEEGRAEEEIETVIERSLKIKKYVVEQDEKESGLRKILNFGHTIGHGIESSEGMSDLYHGECVALGMIPMCGEKIRPRVIAVLEKCGLYRELCYDWEKITEATFHDKKADGDTVTVTVVNEIGCFEMQTMKCLELIELAKNCLKG